MLEMDRRSQLQEELVNNIVEGVDTVLAFFSTYHPDLAQCMKMSAESLITEQAELLKEARENGLTDQDIEEVESRALEDVLREHKGPKSDNEHWMDLAEAVRQFVTPNSYARFCEKSPCTRLRSIRPQSSSSKPIPAVTLSNTDSSASPVGRSSNEDALRNARLSERRLGSQVRYRRICPTKKASSPKLA